LVIERKIISQIDSHENCDRARTVQPLFWEESLPCECCVTWRKRARLFASENQIVV
jgi:hypothetical protein